MERVWHRSPPEPQYPHEHRKPLNRHFPDGRGEAPFRTVHSRPGDYLASDFWLVAIGFESQGCRRGAPRLLLPPARSRRAYRGRTSALRLGEAGVLLGSTSDHDGWAQVRLRASSSSRNASSPASEVTLAP